MKTVARIKHPLFVLGLIVCVGWLFTGCATTQQMTTLQEQVQEAMTKADQALQEAEAAKAMAAEAANKADAAAMRAEAAADRADQAAAKAEAMADKSEKVFMKGMKK